MNTVLSLTRETKHSRSCRPESPNITAETNPAAHHRLDRRGFAVIWRGNAAATAGPLRMTTDRARSALSKAHSNRQYRAPRSRAMRSLSHRSGLPMLSPSRTVCASCERWEPSWEPFAVDRCGRLWTSADCDPFDSGRYGRLRTAMGGLRPSTDQKVGDSSSSGRATKALYGKGFVA